MKNYTYSNIRVAWNESRFPNLLGETMVVYKITFPDESCYFGLTKGSISNILFSICCGKKFRGNKFLADKIKEYKTFLIEILYRGEDEQDLKDYKQFAICSYLEHIAYKRKQKSYNYDPQTVNGKLLNKI